MATSTLLRSSTASAWRRKDSCASVAVATRASRKSIGCLPAFAPLPMGTRSVSQAIVAAVLLAAPAGAQRVRGTVADSATREAIAGAVVSLTDAADKFLARSVADGAGGFSLPRISGAA